MVGQLITLEGTDGSGKGTQAKLLFEALSQNRSNARLYSFPDYQNTFFGQEIGAYLRGEFGTLEQVHPKLVSLLFAGDRFEKKSAIASDLAKGFWVICDRYVDSNIAHQCSKLPQTQRNEFINWLQTLEYDIFKLPKPDTTFFLEVPPDFSKKLVLEKKPRLYTSEKEDIQEANHDYMNIVFETYTQLAEQNDWQKINCTNSCGLRSIDSIHQELLSYVSTGSSGSDTI